MAVTAGEALDKKEKEILAIKEKIKGKGVIIQNIHLYPRAGSVQRVKGDN